MIQLQYQPYEQVPQLAAKDLAYIQEHPSLKPFYNYSATPEQFEQVIRDKQRDTTDREALTRALLDQWKHLPEGHEVLVQIEKLRSNNTFTVTTAHQPSLLTGPLYYIYKIASTIHLAQDLQQRFPDYQFVPVFICSFEDHDFAEVNHLQLFGQRYEWKIESHGPVGFLENSTLRPLLDEIVQKFGNAPFAKKLETLLHEAFGPGQEQYGRSAQLFTQALFENYGLIVADFSTPAMKRLLVPVIRKELMEQLSKKTVEPTIRELEALGFAQQAHARDINLFYIGDGGRNRIVLEDRVYKVLDREYSWSETELLKYVEEHPEHFSPNVVLRPIYQELVLPNLAYIGGGGEIAYWLERKKQFEAFGLNFPMLVRRNSVLWIDKNLMSKLTRWQLTPQDLFQSSDGLVRRFLEHHAEQTLDLTTQKIQLTAIFDSIKNIGVQVDPTLKGSIEAEATRQLKAVEQLESRLVRAEKQKHETSLNQVRALHQKLFPGEGLQERYDNFIPYYLQYGNAWLDTVVQICDPMRREMILALAN